MAHIQAVAFQAPRRLQVSSGSLLHILCCLCLASSSYTEQPCLYPSVWQSQLAAIMTPSSVAAFHVSITPFSNLTTATYTGNAIAIPDYHEVARLESVGLHYIAMLHKDRRRLVLGFRGTVRLAFHDVRLHLLMAAIRTSIAPVPLVKQTTVRTGSYGTLGPLAQPTAASSMLQP